MPNKSRLITPMNYSILGGLIFSFVILFQFHAFGQTIEDDFEGNGNVSLWQDDDCLINTSFNNPFNLGINSSSTVMKYNDYGGLYGNVSFKAGRNLNLDKYYVFTLKVYVPSSSITGIQPNEISLKLQNSNLSSPWSTQCEIKKPVILDQWQTISFDFKNDSYINLDPNSNPPTQRNDFNKVLIQINGENNTDLVTAYIDDFDYIDTGSTYTPIYNTLVWADEFSNNGPIDNTKWFHQTKLPNGGSWYNGEIQHYTDRNDNSVVANGALLLIAKKETYTDQGVTKSYTSARLNSKFAFKYGRVEIRAKLPTGVGTWPALWMLGKNINENGAYWQTQGFGTTGWPACGEIDILEHWGNNQNFVQSAIHTPSSFGSTVNHGGQTISTASSQFHVYSMEWTPDKIVFSVDGNIHYQYIPAFQDANTWPFDAEQYLILNTAIQPTIEPGFSQTIMEIDYVRVYQENVLSLTETPIKPTTHLYPNPVDDVLNIRLPSSLNQNIELQIYGMNGQLLKTLNQNPNGDLITLRQLESLEKGMYIITFSARGENYHLKFIK